MTVLYGYKVYPDQTITTRLSLAVSLIDEYTGKQPIGQVKVFLEGQELKNIKNPSGYYLFPDLPGSEYQVRVEADYYFEEGASVNLPHPNPLNPVVDITLKPGPCYPFSHGTTLIRGMVRDIEENVVPGAAVEIMEKNISNITTEKGEFVLYFKGLTEEDIIKQGSKRFVKGNGGQEIQLKAAAGSKIGYVNLEKVEEGKTTVLEEPIILS